MTFTSSEPTRLDDDEKVVEVLEVYGLTSTKELIAIMTDSPYRWTPYKVRAAVQLGFDRGTVRLGEGLKLEATTCA